MTKRKPLTEEQEAAQRERCRKYRHSPKGRENQRRYEGSPKGLAMYARYNASPKGINRDETRKTKQRKST